MARVVSKKPVQRKPQRIQRVAAFTKACKDLIAAYKSNSYSPGNCPLCVIAYGIVLRRRRENCAIIEHYCEYCLWKIFKPADFVLSADARYGCTGYWKQSFDERILRLQSWIQLMSNQLTVNTKKFKKYSEKIKRLMENGY